MAANVGKFISKNWLPLLINGAKKPIYPIETVNFRISMENEE